MLSSFSVVFAVMLKHPCLLHKENGFLGPLVSRYDMRWDLPVLGYLIDGKVDWLAAVTVAGKRRVPATGKSVFCHRDYIFCPFGKVCVKVITVG